VVRSWNHNQFLKFFRHW